MYIIWSLVVIKQQIVHLIQTMKQYFGTQTVLFITFKHIKTIMIFIDSLYFPYIRIQVKYQGCGNCQSSCINIC